MDKIAPTETVSLLEVHGEVHFSIGGFWKLDEIQVFLDKLDAIALPIVQARKPIHVLGDFEHFVPQNRETGDAIRDHLMTAKKFGLAKVAIVSPSALVKIQYRRLSQGIEVEFFENRSDATAWLRRSN